LLGIRLNDISLHRISVKQPTKNRPSSIPTQQHQTADEKINPRLFRRSSIKLLTKKSTAGGRRSRPPAVDFFDRVKRPVSQ
jgi:hypothetical protein